MRKRTWILLIILLLVILGLLGFWQQDLIKKQMAKYYYRKATVYLEKLDNKNSSAALIKALDWDPEISSREYRNFQKYRTELLSDPEKKTRFLENR